MKSLRDKKSFRDQVGRAAVSLRSCVTVAARVATVTVVPTSGELRGAAGAVSLVEEAWLGTRAGEHGYWKI
jgi:hypothetical protein